MSPAVSIVTVVFNAKHIVEQTIDSVLFQSYKNYEYIVIDGRSTDGTLDVLAKYKSNFAYFVTEPDHGIYDAMNKAIDVAKGEWIIFMNAGDRFVDSGVLSHVFEKERYENESVIYGDTMVQYPWGKILLPARFLSEYDINLPFCHQSAFVRTAILRKYKFDLSYKVAADYRLFYLINKEGGLFAHINLPISQYDMDGFSSKRVLLTFEEVFRATGRTKSLYYYWKWLYLWLRNYVLMCIPQRVVNNIRRNKYKNACSFSDKCCC